MYADNRLSTLNLSALLAFLHCRANEVAMQVGSVPLAVIFTSGVDACTGVVEPSKHLLCATAHPA